MGTSKKLAEALRAYDRQRLYSPGEAVDIVKQLATAKFDETVELAARLGVDPRKADQMVRGTVSLPAGSGASAGERVDGDGQREHPAGDHEPDRRVDVEQGHPVGDRLDDQDAQQRGVGPAAARVDKGSQTPGRTVAATVTDKQVAEIARVKMPDLNANDLDAAKKQVAGTARSMGLKVEG